MIIRLAVLLIIATTAPLSTASPGHSDEPGKSQGTPRAGVPATTTTPDRIVQVEASDRMQFTAPSWSFNVGETVEFVVHNDGQFVHEFVIDSKTGNAQHRESMASAMNNGHMMTHEDVNAVTVEPGETQSITWTFTEAGTFEAACNLPGHYQAGMHKPLHVSGSS